MKGNTIISYMELTSLRDFLAHIVQEAGKAILDIERRNEEGEFDNFHDYEAAFNDPIARQEIAVRAVFYEVNAMIESVLHDLAWEPWLKSDEYPGPKALLDLNKNDELSILKMVQYLPIGKIIKLIEDSYGIKFDKLEGWIILWINHEAVNAFKHRKGFMDFRKGKISIGERYQAEASRAYEVIDAADAFIKSLWEAVS